MRETTDLALAYARAFSGQDGRLVLADLARQGFLEETSFHPEPQRTAFNEGRRSLALHVRRMVEAGRGGGGAGPARPGGAE